MLESLEPRTLLAAPFAVGGDPSVQSGDFRVTTFASGLDFPNGMTRLSDGSFLIATTVPHDTNGYFGAASGQVVRLVDANGDGVADSAPQVLADNLPTKLTDVRLAGKFVLVTSAGSPPSIPPTITILAMGSRPSSPLTVVDTLTFTFPQPWMHYTYGLETRPTPGRHGSYVIFFNVGSQDDGDTTPANLTTAIANTAGTFNGTLHPDSIYKLTITPTKHAVTYSNLRQIAFGVRNSAGIAVQPKTGDLYFEDNGINGGPTGDGDPQLSADELNRIAASQIGAAPQDFGFAHDYIHETTGAHVGSGGVQPLAAFIPINGSYSEGPQDIAFAPAAFPGGVNHGVFVGFYGNGNYGGNGLNNPQNPVIFYNLDTDKYFDFISNDLANIGHPVGLATSPNSLFVADLAPTDDFGSANHGIIYEITALPKTYSIQGNVFATSAGKKTHLSAQTVYIDANANGSLDPGERTAATDARGNYKFQVPAGTYTVREVVPTRFAETGVSFYNVVFKGRRANKLDFANVPIT
jgi:glucose/arabinose dehydrogenase